MSSLYCTCICAGLEHFQSRWFNNNNNKEFHGWGGWLVGPSHYVDNSNSGWDWVGLCQFEYDKCTPKRSLKHSEKQAKYKPYPKVLRILSQRTIYIYKAAFRQWVSPFVTFGLSPHPPGVRPFTMKVEIWNLIHSFLDVFKGHPLWQKPPRIISHNIVKL
jgi:hypothetical protein